jgi:hypothetical protein
MTLCCRMSPPPYDAFRYFMSKVMLGLEPYDVVKDMCVMWDVAGSTAVGHLGV